jgi:biotin carboxylase
MSVLILHRGPLASTPYDRWLRDYGGDILLLASREHLDSLGEASPPGGSGYARFEALDDYHVSGRVEARALALAREYGVRYIVACHERDMERAAQLREILDLPGQRLESAVPFRDKLVMKSLAREAGVPVTPFTDVECAVDIAAFAREHGHPLVLKPRNGSGSAGLRVLHTPEDLDTYLAEGFDLYDGGQPNLMAEAYVPGTVCHVDGLVVAGRTVLASPSQHLPVPGGPGGPAGRAELTLDHDEPLARRLLSFTDAVLAALPGPDDHAFHAEIFHTPDDRLVLCEIACRTGGSGIRDMLGTLYGLDPAEYWVRAQLGLSLPAVNGTQRLRPRGLAGRLLVGRRPGRVLEVPDHPDFPWVEKYRLHVRPGQYLEPPAHPDDAMASFVVSAPTRASCEERMRELATWFDENLRLAALQPG